MPFTGIQTVTVVKIDKHTVKHRVQLCLTPQLCGDTCVDDCPSLEKSHEHADRPADCPL